MIFLIKQ